MTVLRRVRSLLRSGFAAAAMLTATMAVAETPVGSNVDSRVLIGLQANPEGVQGFLPEGWASMPFPAGPLKGANAMLVLIDQHLSRMPDGTHADPATRLAAALVGLGKQTDGDAVRLYVMRIYTTDPASNPYGNSVGADITRTRTLSGDGAPGRQHSESWIIRPETGGELAFDLAYTTGRPNWVSDEAKPHSAANPDFSRIYRFQQLVDLAMSEALGKPLSGEVALTSSVEELDTLLDGSERVAAVMTVPVYLRDISLP